jgi:hypothetical protein
VFVVHSDPTAADMCVSDRFVVRMASSLATLTLAEAQAMIKPRNVIVNLFVSRTWTSRAASLCSVGFRSILALQWPQGTHKHA